MPIIEMRGRRFGRLKVIERAKDTQDGRVQWLCVCSCPKRTKIVVRAESLRAPKGKNVVSCGCLKRERASKMGSARKGVQVVRTEHLNLIGETFGALTVIKRASKQTEKKSTWLCSCKYCPRKTVVRYDMLIRKPAPKSCGCKQYEAAAKGLHYIHGGTTMYPREYISWVELNKRCYDKTVVRYKNYGGRGIRVCKRWRKGEDGKHPFSCFLEDMGKRPMHHSIHRVDNDGDYEPSNCIWADGATQAEARAQSRRNK